jgi:hypothetical protein
LSKDLTKKFIGNEIYFKERVLMFKYPKNILLLIIYVVKVIGELILFKGAEKSL